MVQGKRDMQKRAARRTKFYVLIYYHNFVVFKSNQEIQAARAAVAIKIAHALSHVVGPTTRDLSLDDHPL